MPEKQQKRKDEKRESKVVAEGAGKKSEKNEHKADKKSQGPMLIAAAIVIILVIAAIAIAFHSSLLTPTVPFSTFKSGLDSSGNISVTATYANLSQYANESVCFTSMIQVLAHTRKPSTINFYIIDNATATCTYSSSGFGSSVNPVTTNSTYCISKAYSEPGIFLNYSNYNSTDIYSNRMYIYGNDNYMTSCPIAVELS